MKSILIHTFIIFLISLSSTLVIAGEPMSCQDRAYNATLGLFRGGSGASGTIVGISKKADVTVLEVYTDKHVIQGVCPGIKAGETCQPSVLIDPKGCPSSRTPLNVQLRAQSESSGEDAAYLWIKIPNSNSALPCLTSLETTKTLQIKEPDFRVGYGGGQKELRTGYVTGFIETKVLIPWDGRTAPKVTSRTTIKPGDCGGPVVLESSCKVIGLSQIGPIQGQSLDIISIYPDGLRAGRDIPREEVTAALPVEEPSAIFPRNVDSSDKIEMFPLLQLE